MTNRYWTNNDPGSNTGYPVSWAPGLPDANGVIVRFACIRLGWGVDENGDRLPSPVGPALYYPSNHACRGIVSVAAVTTVDSSGATVRGLEVTTDWEQNGWYEAAGSQVLAPDPTLTRKGLRATAASGGGLKATFVLRSSKPLGSYAADVDLPPQSNIFDPGIDNVWLTMTSLATQRIE